MADDPLYNKWATMKWRCSSPSPKAAPWAGRGIKVCDEWANSWPAFEAWARANGYCKGLSIDRIDVDGNYEPSNCRWVTRSENSKAARANYNYVRKNVMPAYNEPWFGDY
jgi:hypothetical protein